MLDIQQKLLELFPSAIHFIDTPVIARTMDFFKAMTVIQKPVHFYSLEDWPLMPNFRVFKTAKIKVHSIQVGYLGILNHFFSVVRGVGSSLFCFKAGAAYRAGRSRLLFPKNFDICSFKFTLNGKRQVTDDMLFNAPSLVDGDKITRTVEGSTVIYTFENYKLKFNCPEEIISQFDITRSRKDAHEFDKMLALFYMFSECLSGRYDELYSVKNSIKDSLASLIINRLGFGFLF